MNMNKKKSLTAIWVVLSVLFCGVVLFLVINSYSRNRMIRDEIAELASSAQNAAVRKYSLQDIVGLPTPVQRYFRYVLKEDAEYIRFARMKTVGQFRRPLQKEWTEMETRQYFTAEPPGMIFDAVMKQGPVWFAIRDKYWLGKGEMLVNILSGFNVLSEAGSRELDETSFIRWVGEAVLFPTALLPSEHIAWQPVNEESAQLKVTDRGNSGLYRVYFNELGEITRYESDNRYDKIDGRFQKTGSIALRSEYREVDGIKVPMAFLITRILPDGTQEEFWKGRVTEISFDAFKGLF